MHKLLQPRHIFSLVRSQLSQWFRITQSLDSNHVKPKDTPLHAFLKEFLANSGHFLILKNLADLTVYGWQTYVTDPTEYLLVGAMLLQTLYLSRAKAHRFFGNFMGVGLYTLIDLPVDGSDFFQSPAHVAFWIFSLTIAVLQSMATHWKPSLENWTVPLESVTRMFMVLVFYLVVKLGDQSNFITAINYFRTFSNEATHIFLMLSLLLIGLLLGFQRLQILNQQKALQKTAAVLENLAKWGMGRHVVDMAVTNLNQLDFRQCDRAILFMDIRGFTVWCENTDTRTVAETLNRYYQQVERAAGSYSPLRLTFTGDEIMAIYATPDQAVEAAQAMQAAAKTVLQVHHLGAGCAVHYGTVVEGLFGGNDVRTYTVIGDVVNTAKRLEGSTPAGEISISDLVYHAIQQDIPVKESRSLSLKGKATPLLSWLLA